MYHADNSRVSVLAWLCAAMAIVEGGPPRRPVIVKSQPDATRLRASQPHPITVADVIRLTSIGGDFGIDAAVRSPNGQAVATVLRRGDLRRNATISTLVIFRTRSLLATPRPDTILTFASASNYPPIAHLRWLADNQTLAFLGSRSDTLSTQRGDALPQVYIVDTRTHRWRQRTHHTTAVTAFDVARNDDILYAAQQSSDTIDGSILRRHGFFVRATQYLTDVVADRLTSGRGAVSLLFLVRRGASAAVTVRSPGPMYGRCWDQLLSLSPDGTHALLACMPIAAPPTWTGYTDPAVGRLIHGLGVWPQYLVLDLARSTLEPLVDAPAIYPNFAARAAWAPDGQSVVIGNTYLPLTVRDSSEHAWRTGHRAVAEIDIGTHVVTIITRQDSLDVMEWDPVTDVVELAPGLVGSGRDDSRRVRYRKTGAGWSPVAAERNAMLRPVLVIEQGMNMPPRLVARVPATGQRRVVTDPNSGLLGQFRLGGEAVVHWTTKSGMHWDGGLYLPPSYVPHHRYPLVIQTHGFDSTAFWPDGPYATANAAQPLAGAGFVVLQMGEEPREGIVDVMPSEASTMQESIEAAIDHLDSLGFINRAKVGVIGFSRTCYYVEYLLTHSDYPFAAAVMADGIDMGYLQYLLFARGDGGTSGNREMQAVNGGMPFGDTLAQWRARAPGFNLDKVRAPLLLQAIGSGSPLAEWEPYAMLAVQHKPVEMLYLPEGAHVLVKPWERLASQQGSVDWMRFWILSEVDPDPTKAAQYAHWHRLRMMRDSTEVKTTSAAKPAEGH